MKKRLVSFLLVLILLVPCVASAATWYRLNTSSLRLWSEANYKSRVLDSYRQDWALNINKAVNSTWANVTFSNGVSGYLERKFLVRCNSYGAWVTKDKTAMKHGPGYSFATVDTLSRGDKVTVLTHGSSFDYVKSGESYGYVANASLSKKKVTATSSGSGMKSVNYTAWVTSNGGVVGLRSMPSSSNEVIFARYTPGTKVTVTGEGSDFCYVTIGSESGYMRTKYLTKKKPATASTFTPYTAVVVLGKDEKKAPVYQGEGLGWSISMKLDAGATVEVVANGTDKYWVKVNINGHNYYMQKKYLKKQ